MTEEQRPGSNITDELSKLGNQVAEALRLAWESDERKRLQNEVIEGLQRFNAEVEQTARRASDSEAARRVRTQADEVVNRARQSDAVDDIREGLLTGLQSINRELSRLLARLESGKTSGAGPIPPEAPAQTTVTGETNPPPAPPSGPDVQI